MPRISALLKGCGCCQVQTCLDTKKKFLENDLSSQFRKQQGKDPESPPRCPGESLLAHPGELAEILSGKRSCYSENEDVSEVMQRGTRGTTRGEEKAQKADDRMQKRPQQSQSSAPPSHCTDGENKSGSAIRSSHPVSVTSRARRGQLQPCLQ